MKKISCIFFITLFTLCVPRALPETIELKDGKTVVVDIVEEKEDAIMVSKDGGNFVYSISRDKIKVIRPSTPEEIEETREPESASSAGAVKATDKDKEYLLEKYEQEVLAAQKARGRLKIKFVKDQFGAVETMLNGKVKAVMLADTGASIVVISGEVAKKLGLDLSSQKGVIQVVLADGRTTTAIPITLKSVEVGNSKVKDVEAAVTENPPGPGIDGLLGMTFLRYFHVKLDSKENCLVLEKY